MSHDQLKELTKEIDRNNDVSISKQEFTDFMLEFFKKLLFEQENDMSYLKRLFQEADIDHSGFLSVDELYNLFNLKLEVEIWWEELEELIGTADADSDNKINIDEFIQLMTWTLSEQGSSDAKNTIARIRQAKMINVMDLATLLKRLPHHYEESFSHWMYQRGRILPS